jgi:uncharacterized protein YegP (UPF0339 family)
MSHATRRLTAGIALCLLLLIAALETFRPASAAQDKAPAATFEVYQDKGGEYRWRLRAQNTQVLATSSEGYKEKRSCLANIDSVKKNAPNAPVQDKPAAE